jgi:ABC-type transport system involved in cytochrome bd biosynthesis fused ATPase/permease subunit
LKFGLKTEIKDEQIMETLNEVGLSKRFNNLDEKIFGGSGDAGKTSGGETSRIGLARVLLKIRSSDSKLVFLDEPTASVDQDTKQDIAEIINNEKAKRPETTFIVISHDEKFVEMLDCSIRVEMERGKIIEK